MGAEHKDKVGPDPFAGVPVSAGFPPLVVGFAIVCLILIFGTGAWTVFDSTCGHVWPWAQTLKIDLTAVVNPTHSGPFGDCYGR